LGGLCQACDGESDLGASVFGPVHAPRGDQQSPLGLLRWRASHLPLERLCAWKQTASHDAHRIGISAALRATHSAARVRAHSPVRLPCKSISRGQSSLDPHTASGRFCSSPQSHSFNGYVAVSSMRSRHASRLPIHCSAAYIPMSLSRHLLMQSTIIHGPTTCLGAPPHSCVLLLPTASIRAIQGRILSNASSNRGSSATARAPFRRTPRQYWNFPAVPNLA
jgi:hypothetical protein